MDAPEKLRSSNVTLFFKGFYFIARKQQIAM